MEEKRGYACVGDVVGALLGFESEVYEYVDVALDKVIVDESLREIVKNNELQVRELIKSWPYKSSSYARNSGLPLANMKTEYGVLGITSIETMNLFRSIADSFDPVSGGYVMKEGACGDPMTVFVETKGVAVRVVNVMAMVQLWGLSQFYGEYPEVKAFEKYAKFWLELFFPGLDTWNKMFEEMGERTTDPAVRQAAQTFTRQYAKWRKSLDAALAADGLTMPGLQQTQQATQ